MSVKALPITGMTPRELLTLWRYLGYLDSQRRATAERPIAPAEGPRGLRRRARRHRAALNARRLQRNTMRSYHEREKRAAAWSFESCAYSEQTHAAHCRIHGRCPGCGS